MPKATRKEQPKAQEPSKAKRKAAPPVEVDARTAPVRASGRPWDERQIVAAQRRAEGKTWEAIAEELGYARETCHDWARDGRWPELLEWMRAKLFEARRAAWIADEADLAMRGIKAAYGAYYSIMNGEQQPDGSYPAASLRLAAAESFFDAIGFSEARRRIALLEVDIMAAAAAQEEDEEVDEFEAPKIVDIGITGVKGSGT